jgi:hypothetical protein
MEKIFISYTHADESFVKKLRTDLQGKFNIWVDESNIVSNVPLIEQIAANNEASPQQAAGYHKEGHCL